MFFAIAMCAAKPAVGGWKQVKTNSEFVQNVRPYVTENYLKILPEYKRRNTLFVIESAEVQVVNGYNIHIIGKLGFDAIELTLYVPPSHKIQLTSCNLLPANDPEKSMMGAWRIRDVDYEPEAVNEVIKNYQKTNGLTASVNKILLLRTQLVAGMNYHIVFQDSEGMTHSIVVYRALNGKCEINSADSF